MKMVNRTFRGKDAGLLVGYAPLAENLQRALDEYTEADRPSVRWAGTCPRSSTWCSSSSG
jgi:hypothetical protein